MWGAKSFPAALSGPCPGGRAHCLLAQNTACGGFPDLAWGVFAGHTGCARALWAGTWLFALVHTDGHLGRAWPP